MLSRLFWIGLTGIALVAGFLLQEHDNVISFVADSSDGRIERSIEARVERAVERGVSESRIVDSRGRTIAVDAATREQLSKAIARLVAAESRVAMLRMRDADPDAMDAPRAEADAARAEIDRIKEQIEQRDDLSNRDRRAIQRQIRSDVRDGVRDAVRTATAG